MAADAGLRQDLGVNHGSPAETAEPAPMIELRRLTKAFGRKMVLRGIDLTVAVGESLVIFGPNGAGKTTLIRILAGLSRPSGGVLRVGGLDMATHSDGIRGHLGVVSHAPLLYDSLTGEENLRFFASLYSLPNPGPRIMELLEQVGLAQRRKDLVRTYSRGMVQRLAIARAILHDPEVLLLDEPDTGLDPQAAEMLHNLLARLGGESNRTIITITHSLERGLSIADRVALLVNGRIVYQANARGLSSQDFRPLYDQYVGSGR
jgi:heme exporter protein A